MGSRDRLGVPRRVRRGGGAVRGVVASCGVGSGAAGRRRRHRAGRFRVPAPPARSVGRPELLVAAARLVCPCVTGPCRTGRGRRSASHRDRPTRAGGAARARPRVRAARASEPAARLTSRPPPRLVSTTRTSPSASGLSLMVTRCGPSGLVATRTTSGNTCWVTWLVSAGAARPGGGGDRRGAGDRRERRAAAGAGAGVVRCSEVAGRCSTPGTATSGSSAPAPSTRTARRGRRGSGGRCGLARAAAGAAAAAVATAGLSSGRPGGLRRGCGVGRHGGWSRIGRCATGRRPRSGGGRGSGSGVVTGDRRRPRSAVPGRPAGSIGRWSDSASASAAPAASVGRGRPAVASPRRRAGPGPARGTRRRSSRSRRPVRWSAPACPGTRPRDQAGDRGGGHAASSLDMMERT